MTALHCPSCGRALASKAQFAELLEAPLSYRHRALIEALVRAYPREITRDALFDAIYGLDPSGGPDGNVVAVLMSQLRHQVLPRYGWTIANGQKGRGNPGRYRLQHTEEK